MAQQLVNIPWATGPGNIQVVWDDADPSPTEVKISSTDVHQEQRSQVITFKSTEYDAEAPLTVNQAATEITYTLTPVLSSTSPIAASGGSITVEKCELKEFHNGVLSGTSEVTPDSITGTADGFTVSENTITAANRGTVEGDVRSIQITCSYLTSRGITAQGTATISQAANNRVIVYGKPTITSFEVADIPASGGSVSSGSVEYSQSRHYYYDSGVTEELSALTTGGEVTFGDPVTAESLGTTVKDRTIVGQLTCQVSMNGQTSVEGDASVYQQENTFISWDIDHSPINLPSSGETNIYINRLAWNWTSGHYSIQDGRYLDAFQILTQIESDLIDDVYEGVNGNQGSFDFDNVGVVSNDTSSSKSGTLYLNITTTHTSIFDHTEEISITQSAG